MATVPITLALTGDSLVEPTKAGLAPTTTPSITINGADPTRAGAATDVLESTNATPTLQFSLTRDTSQTWQANTYLVALVFDIQVIQGAKGARTSLPTGFTPSSILQKSSNSTLQLSSHTWAANLLASGGKSTAVTGSAFTYLVPPPTVSDPNGTNSNWTLDVKWTQVTNSKLVDSYPQSSTGKPQKPTLAMKYRAYCFTTSFGLWYVDPELDLCPQG